MKHIAHLSLLAGLAIVGGLVATATPGSAAAGLLVVHQGESVQQAVDTARPGDVILLGPGTYRGSVSISVPGLTIRGSGSRTVIVPGAAPRGNACAAAGHGVCVTGTPAHPVSDVRIESLSVRGFRKNGILGENTDRMQVRDVLAVNNGAYGIAQENSTRGRLRDNEARGNKEAGIFLGDTQDARGTVVTDNRTSGGMVGILARRVQKIDIRQNRITGNCGGIFVVHDGKKPVAGYLTIRDNLVYRNNAYCAARPPRTYIQGSGIVLVGAEHSVVAGNEVTGHRGASHLSGGIVLVRSVAGGPSNGNLIRNNVSLDNTPGDLVHHDGGIGNRFAGNVCGGGRSADGASEFHCQTLRHRR